DQTSPDREEAGGTARRRPARSRDGATALWEAWQAPPESGPDPAAAFAPRWLSPRSAELLVGEHGTLRLLLDDKVYDGVFAVRALPATCPGRYISLRRADADGLEHELGIVRDLAEWPGPARALLEESLLRRYFVRVITAVEGIELKHG